MKILKSWKEKLLNNQVTFEKDPIELKKYVSGNIQITDTVKGLVIDVIDTDGNPIQQFSPIQTNLGDTITLKDMKILIETTLKIGE